MASSQASIEVNSRPERIGPPAIAIRAVWIAAAALLVGLFIAALPFHLHEPLEGFGTAPAAGSSPDSLFGVYIVVLEVLVTLAFVAAGGVVFWSRPQERLALLVSLTLVAIGVAFPPVIYSLESASPVWFTVARVVRMLADVSGVIFIMYVFPDGRFVPRWMWVLAALWVARNVALLLFPAAPFNPDTWPVPLWTLDAVIWFGTGLASQIFRALQAPTPAQQQQSRWLIFGLVMAAPAFLVSYTLSPIIAPFAPAGTALSFAIPGLATALTIICPAAIAIAFLRFRLADIDVVSNRTFIYATLIAILGGLLALFVSVLMLFIRAVSWSTEALAAFFAMVGVILLFAPLQRYVQRVIDRTFYPTKLDYQQLLPELSADLAAKIVFSDLAAMLTEELPRRLQISRAMVLTYAPERQAFTSLPSVGEALSVDHPFVRHLRQTDRPILRASLDAAEDAEVLAFMDEHAVEVSIPLRRGTILMGAYNLGSKLSGAPYRRDDIQLLSMLMRQVAISLENAHLYEELRVHRDHLVDLIEKHTAQIRSEQEKLATVLANAGDAIIIIGVDGLVEYVNNAWLQQSGFLPEDILAMDVRTAYAEPVPEEIAGVFEDALQSQKVWRGEAMHRRKDDDPFPVEIAVSALGDEAGMMTHYVISQRDVSLQKAVEQFKADFISDVLHELRTPLTNLKLFLELLEIGPQDKRDHYVEKLHFETFRLERLVEDLVILLRLEQGAIPLEISPLDPNELAESVIAACKERAAEKTLTIEFVRTDGLPPLQADRLRIEQALTNLLVNAIAYTEPGGAITVWVGSANREDAAYVIVGVRDTGIGIEPEEQTQIFDRFYRTASAKRSGIPGTGLGLAIVRQIMAMHDGDVTVQSQPGAGSTFTLWLPAPDGQED